MALMPVAVLTAIADTSLRRELFAAVLVVVFAAAAAIDSMGAHSLFGGFVAGLCFPELSKKLDSSISLVLLPLFFALTGMRIRLDLLGGSATWFFGS